MCVPTIHLAQGELYRKILYLTTITADFSPCLAYLSHLLAVLSSIHQLLPANKATLVMTKVEVRVHCLLSVTLFFAILLTWFPQHTFFTLLKCGYFGIYPS